jgi:purine/pyrimidine-nucleoside phosphorylase
MINVNEYFNGQVKSLAYETSAGKSTIGVINPGEYEFSTSQEEIMTVIEGELTAFLPLNQNWETFGKGQHFVVPAHTAFKVKATDQTAYLCQYR